MVKPEPTDVDNEQPENQGDEETLRVQTVPLQGGLANSGMFKHELTPGLGDTPMALVEKRMQNAPRHQAEFDICQRIAKLNRYGYGFSPLAQILSVSETKTDFTILMPFYEGVGTKLQDWRAHAKLFAQAVHRLNQIDLAVPTDNMTLTLLKQVKAAIQPDAESEAFTQQVLELFDAPCFEAASKDTVKSHNDLYFPNAAVEPQGDTHELVFIDMGHLGHNQIGAEFHHFLRAANLGLCDIEMVDIMFTEYARLTGRDKFMIASNAHYFALLRMSDRLRSLSRKKDEQSVKTYQRETVVGKILLSGARDLQKLQG